MQLADIPELRKQFRKIETDRIEKIHNIPRVSRTGDPEYDDWKYHKKIVQINTEAAEEQRALCEKLFGCSLSSYEFDVDPDEVLDWIEHFLEAV